MKRLLLVLCIGCTPSQNLSKWEEGSIAHVYIDDPSNFFSEEDLADIDNALRQWESATDEAVTFEYVNSTDHDSLIIIRTQDYASFHKATGKTSITNFTTVARGGEIILPYDLEQNKFRLNAIHEVGHALNLDHDGPDTVMFPFSEHSADAVTCADVWQFCNINDCDPWSKPICQ